MSIEMPELQQWLEARPSLIGIAQADVRLLAQYVETGGSLLRALGPKLSRSCEQLRTAKLIHETCRLLRRQFLDLHAEWVYYILTNGLTVRKGLQELVFEAAELCAGLVPTSAEIALEKNQLQINKEGFEIDQGLFFHALLRSPKIGTHLIESARQPTARALGLIDSFCNEAQLNLGCVAIERRGCAAYLTMNNGYCLNAEDDCLVDDIETAVDLALLDGNVKVGVLRGGIMTHPRYAGRRVFSAGLNLKALRAGQISFVGCMLRREFGYINKIVRGLRLDDELVEGYKKQASKGAVEKPWIAAVDGFAIGGGAQLLLIADRVIAASDSYFSLPAAHEGIIAGFSNQRLARFLGSRKARQVILKGRKIWANEPDAQLLIDEVVNPGDLEAAIEQNIYQLATSAVVANRHMLNVAEEPLATFLQYAAEFAFVQAERLYSEDVLGKT